MDDWMAAVRTALEKADTKLGKAYEALEEAADKANPAEAGGTADNPALTQRKRDWTELSILAEEATDVQDRVVALKRRLG